MEQICSFAGLHVPRYTILKWKSSTPKPWNTYQVQPDERAATGLEWRCQEPSPTRQKVNCFPYSETTAMEISPNSPESWGTLAGRKILTHLHRCSNRASIALATVKMWSGMQLERETSPLVSIRPAGSRGSVLADRRHRG